MLISANLGTPVSLKFGRKTLLILGAIGEALVLFLLFLISYLPNENLGVKYLNISFICVYLIIFNFTLGPIVWTY